SHTGCFLFPGAGARRVLRPFPTRRSSDLPPRSSPTAGTRPWRRWTRSPPPSTSRTRSATRARWPVPAGSPRRRWRPPSTASCSSPRSPSPSSSGPRSPPATPTPSRPWPERSPGPRSAGRPGPPSGCAPWSTGTGCGRWSPRGTRATPTPAGAARGAGPRRGAAGEPARAAGHRMAPADVRRSGRAERARPRARDPGGLAGRLPVRDTARLPPHAHAGGVGRRPPVQRAPLPPLPQRSPRRPRSRTGLGARRPAGVAARTAQRPRPDGGPAPPDRRNRGQPAAVGSRPRGPGLVGEARPALLPGVPGDPGRRLGRRRPRAHRGRARCPGPGLGPAGTRRPGDHRPPRLRAQRRRPRGLPRRHDRVPGRAGDRRGARAPAAARAARRPEPLSRPLPAPARRFRRGGTAFPDSGTYQPLAPGPATSQAPLMELELRHLKTIRAIADAGSLTRAATELGLAQPALSAQLKRIERALGGALFERGRHGVRVTALGELVLERTRVVLPAVTELQQ